MRRVGGWLAAIVVASSLVTTAGCGGGTDDRSDRSRPEPRVAPTSGPTTSEPTPSQPPTSPPTLPPTPTPTPTTGPAADPIAPADGAPEPDSATQADPLPTSTEALALVGSLAVAPESPRDGYDRDLFGEWVDQFGVDCDTRCRVLADQRQASLPGAPGGGWFSAYDGLTVTDPADLDVDHVVALAEAWESGAATWEPSRRQAFANDTDGELEAVTSRINRSKGDDDPAEWQPPNAGSWCGFAFDWTRVKVRWGLTADPAERDALARMVQSCPN